MQILSFEYVSLNAGKPEQVPGELTLSHPLGSAGVSDFQGWVLSAPLGLCCSSSSVAHLFCNDPVICSFI